MFHNNIYKLKSITIVSYETFLTDFCPRFSRVLRIMYCYKWQAYNWTRTWKKKTDKRCWKQVYSMISKVKWGLKPKFKRN